MNKLVKRESAEIALSESARDYAKKSRSANTLRAYRAAWRHFKYYVRFGELPPRLRRRKEQREQAEMCQVLVVDLPVDGDTIANYLADLAASGAKVKSVENKLTAIGWAHRINGVLDPTVSEAVKAVMDGIRKDIGYNVSKKEPATLAEIQAMLATLPQTVRGKRDKAILLVGFAGAFRRSELVALDVADVRMDGKLSITVRKSKTDQRGEGLKKTIPELSDKTICPVVALRDWLDVADIRSGPVFRRVDRHDNIYQDRLTSQSVALVVKQAAKDADLDWRAFSGHSLRSGFITEALNAGASDSDITEQTGQTVQTMRDYRKNTGVGASRAVLAAFGESRV